MEINRKKMEKMEERLEKIDLRDTVKMSLRYIYKVSYSKLSNEMNYVTKIWEQIEEIEKLLSKPKFQRYSFISNFIDVINFSKLTNLNNVTHDSNQTRNFENIKKFLQRYSDENLDKVSNFFKDLPKIDKFIEDEDLKDLLRKLLVDDPKERINWDDYFKHKFFNIDKFDFDKVENIVKA